MVRCIVQLITMVMFLLMVRPVMMNWCQRVLGSVMKLFLRMVRFMMKRFFMVGFIMVKYFMVVKLLFMMVMIIVEQRFQFIQGKVFIMKHMKLLRVFRQMEGPLGSRHSMYTYLICGYEAYGVCGNTIESWFKTS